MRVFHAVTSWTDTCDNPRVHLVFLNLWTVKTYFLSLWAEKCAFLLLFSVSYPVITQLNIIYLPYNISAIYLKERIFTILYPFHILLDHRSILAYWISWYTFLYSCQCVLYFYIIHLSNVPICVNGPILSFLLFILCSFIIDILIIISDHGE